jgi:hypothetical protein
MGIANSTGNPKRIRGGRPTSILSWMESFHHPVLNRLIKTGYADNLSRQTAGVRILWRAHSLTNGSVRLPKTPPEVSK